MSKTYSPCVAICLPFYDKITVQFFRSFNRLWRPSSASEQFGHQGATHTLDTYTHPIVEARTILTESALEVDPPATHLLFIDDDEEFPPHALKRLLGHKLPIVGGLCHNRRQPYAPIMMRRHKNGRDGLGFVYHYPENQLVEVDATGAGFLLVERNVIEAMTKAYGAGNWWKQIDGQSEDFSFCTRARDLGFTIHVDTGLEIGHVGEVVVYSDFAKKNRAFAIERWAPEPDIARDGAPCASIIIPTFNQDPKHLRAAVLSASFQTVPIEVLIVDDGSDPPVPEEGWPKNVKVVRHDLEGWPDETPKNQGIAKALNTGIRAMQTDWFSWLSSDDLLDPRKIEMQLAHLRAAGPQAKLSFHRYQVFQDGSRNFAQFSELYSWKTVEEQMQILGQGCVINGSTVMIHRSVFDEVGVFNPEFHYGQDWEFFCRAGERYLWHGISEILGSRREKSTNLTNQITQSARADARRLRRDAEDAAIRDRYGNKAA